MASKRPGFSRVDTDRAASLIQMEENAPPRTPKEKEMGTFDKDASVVEAIEPAPRYDSNEHLAGDIHADTIEDITTQVITVEDDPTVNPWTFRMFFLGA